MKWNGKRVISVFILALILTLGVAASVQAKTKNITRKFKDKSKVMNVISMFDAVALEDPAGRTTTHNFSKNAVRKDALQKIGQVYYDEYDGDPVEYIKDLSKAFFGKSTSGLTSYDWYDGFGYGEPEYRSIQYYQCSSSSYRVKAQLYMGYDGYDEVVYDKMASCTFDLQKKRGTRYGYILKKMSVTRTYN